MDNMDNGVPSPLDEEKANVQALKQSLIQQEKMSSLGKLMAGIAHELNTPLGVISSGNDLILRIISKIDMEELPPSAARFITKIKEKAESNRKASDQMLRIVSSLKVFARQDEVELYRERPVDLIEDTLTILHNAFKRSIQLERHYRYQDAIFCYPSRLTQVFLNILTNARQAIEESGKNKDGHIGIEVFHEPITGGCGPSQGMVTIIFRDNGTGIKPEVMDKLFESGFTTKNVRIGTGLGLSICKAIIAAHNGDIEARNREDGVVGAEFCIHLPVNPRECEPIRE